MGVDLTTAFFAFLLSYLLSTRCFSVGTRISNCTPILVIFTFFLVTSMYFLDGYKPVEDRRSERELEITVKAICLAFLLTTLLTFIAFKGLVLSRYIILSWWLIALFLLPSLRLGLREVYKALWRRGYLRQRVLVIGRGRQVKAIRDRLAIQRHSRFEYVGVVTEDNTSSGSTDGIPVLGSLGEVERVIQKYGVHRAFICPSGLPYEKVSELVRLCRNHNLAVNILSEEFNGVNQRISIDGFTGLLTIEADGEKPFSRGLNRLLKRTIDVFGAVIGLLTVTLLYPLFALLIKLEDSGPIIYRRKVVGEGGAQFDAFKFRSMKVNADEVLNSNPKLKGAFEKNYKLKNDPRLTRVGRFIRRYSLDEFPQFLNVLKGQMSLVGPRMIVKSELEKYGQWAQKRLSVKPGITGFWQVSGRQNTDYDERVRMDMFYIDHWSIWMDIIILVKTVWKVLRKEGAY
ncbi:MAG: sugar transferase [Candidatus Marinimicrobia bacterium]|nr:sugar transferase [Candidatus Neomarinimicrobiota bacterium]